VIHTVLNIIKRKKFWIMRWSRHAARIGEEKNAYEILIYKTCREERGYLRDLGKRLRVILM
jgi:hypothetical protein